MGEAVLSNVRRTQESSAQTTAGRMLKTDEGFDFLEILFGKKCTRSANCMTFSSFHFKCNPPTSTKAKVKMSLLIKSGGNYDRK